MASILDEIMKLLPKEAEISEACFEGANIILYTKSKDFFLDNKGVIKNVVDNIKKRVELRCDPAMVMDLEKAENAIKKLLPEEAKVGNINFDPQRAVVAIESEKPGLAIGKQGEILKEIRKKTLWVPTIVRMPALRSKIIENIRQVLYEHSDYRKKFLNKIGHRIYDGWVRGKKDEWVRVTYLGGARQVGRSCILLQTPESRVLLDCGVNVAAKDQDAYPYFDVPEFKLEELDAVILSHAHLDHSGIAPVLFKMGYRGPVYCTAPTRDISALLALDFIGVAFKEANKGLFSSTDVKEMMKHTITLEYGEVTDITPDIRITLYNAGHVLGSSLVHLHIGNGLHNLLYSLDWKSQVVTLDENDNVNFTPIGELVDDLFCKYQNLVKKGNGYEELYNLEGIKTMSFNPETYKTEVKKITSFIRHPINEDLYEIKTSSGRKVVVTKSHSVFSAIDNGVNAIKVSDLNVGDFIVGPKIIPNTNKLPKVDLLNHSDKLRIKIEDNNLLNEKIETHKKELNKLFENDREEALNWVKDHYEGCYKNDIAKKYKVHPRRISRVFKKFGIKDHPRVKHALPETLVIDKDLARFLGYYIAEGSIRKNSQTISISNYNREILDDCDAIIKKTFDIDTDIREDCILIHSKQLKYLLCEILECGKNAYSKRVCKEILFSDKEVMRNFLYGYFSGDGGIRTRNESREIMAGSKSPLLIQDIVFMLLQFGIVPTIQYNNYTEMHIATIYNKDKIEQFIDEIGINNAGLIKIETALKNVGKKASFDLRVPITALSEKAQLMLVKSSYRDAKSCGIDILKDKFKLRDRIIDSDFLFDQVVSIKKVKPTSKFVYDFKVDGYENFLGGDGFLFLHNTGDLKYARSNLLDAAETRFPRLETVLIESTYGGKDNILKSRQETEMEIFKIINNHHKLGGKILIPVLGVGRAQEVSMLVDSGIRKGLIPKIPVFVQGMVWDVTAIHTAYPDFLNSNIRKAIFHNDQNPFLSDVFKRVGSKKEQQEVIEDTGSCIIIATSGMMTAGPSVEYFKNLADNPKNALLFVSYQGEGCLGRKIQDGERHFILTSADGKPETVDVKMAVYIEPGLTGHSTRPELMNYVKHLSPKPRRVLVNHGESSRCLDLAASLHKAYKIETSAPRNLETVRLR